MNDVGRITFLSKTNYRVLTSEGERNGVLTGKFAYQTERVEAYPYIGDWVTIQDTSDKDLVVITSLIPRKNKISRKMRGNQLTEQIIACNVDFIILCISANENFSMTRLERYLYAFSTENAKIVVVLTKKDLVDNIEDYISQINKQYPKLEVLATSIHDELSKEKLLPFLAEGTTSVVIGSSGVGKSTLINHIVGKEVLQTGAINEKTHKGKHTTTFRKLIYMGEGFGCIIDTPGMRSISLWNCDEGNEAFSDIEELTLQCKFRNCTHTIEKECSLLEAVKQGYVSEERYRNYMKLKQEENYINSKMDIKAARENNKRIKERESAKRNK